MKIRRKNTAVAVSLQILGDGNVTPAAKGLFAFLVGVSPYLDVTYKLIKQYNKVGDQGMKSLIKELEDHGYLEIKPVNGVDQWILHNGEPLKVRRKQMGPRRNRKSKREWTDQRIQERREFVLAVQAAVKKMKDPKPPKQIVEDFIRYWGQIDSIDPSKKLPFQTKPTFNIPSRIRTFMRLDQQRENQQKKQDRL